MKKFHERLDFLMGEVLNISGNSLATQLGLNQGLVNRYRKGETSPSIEFAVSFCNHFGISANFLILNVGPVKLKEIAVSNGGVNPEIERAEQRKAMASDLSELETFLSQMKQKYSSL